MKKTLPRHGIFKLFEISSVRRKSQKQPEKIRQIMYKVIRMEMVTISNWKWSKWEETILSWKYWKKKRKPCQFQNSTPNKNIFQKWRWNKDLFRYIKTKKIHHQIFPLRTIKEAWAEKKWYQMEICIYAKEWRALELVATWVKLIYLYLIP